MTSAFNGFVYMACCSKYHYLLQEIGYMSVSNVTFIDLFAIMEKNKHRLTAEGKLNRFR